MNPSLLARLARTTTRRSSFEAHAATPDSDTQAALRDLALVLHLTNRLKAGMTRECLTAGK